jgi:hypothetical protein
MSSRDVSAQMNESKSSVISDIKYLCRMYVLDGGSDSLHLLTLFRVILVTLTTPSLPSTS